MPHHAYLSLGSNLGNREQNLYQAIEGLESLGAVAALSSFYETEPVEFAAQGWFINCAILLATDRTPLVLLQGLLALELAMGRRRTQKKGPRNIDIDILLYDDLIVETEGLTIPHAALQERRFVLEPLAEIAPEVRHPVLGKTMRELLDSLPPGSVVRKIPAR